MQNRTYEVLSVSDTTKTVTANNTVTGYTGSKGNFSPTVGNFQTTSYVPVKMGRVRYSASCPSCQNSFQWIEVREIEQWTDPNGNISYRIPGYIGLP